ncbi:MAG: hypothetical protein H6745_07940 [Deltaproteobacteria bacterium]|nr:hypothetical protein [Deltaproteobacteria bacterium]
MNRTPSLAVLALLGLLALAPACGDDGGGGASDTGAADTVGGGDTAAGDTGGTPGNRFADRTPPSGQAALGGKIVDQDGNPVANQRVAACSQQECPIVQTDADGIFFHASLPPDRPRAIYSHGTHSFRNPGPTYATVVVRQAPAADTVVDVGDLVLPVLEGEPVAVDPAVGGTFLLADGAFEVTIAAGALDFAIGTPEESEKLQAGHVAVADLPMYASRPWAGKEARSVAFSTAPWEAHSAEPVAFVVHGSTEAAGTVFDVYQVEPFTTDVEVVAEPEKVGTATVDENGDIVSDAGGTLESLIVVVLVPQT